ncbi:hypothetical protein ACGFQG_19175 [Nocardia fluminea]|uniref:hypothetical protein n=1 Tax=Nocardia fluminea TaxID=134984 RepID=UPI00371522F0
MRTVYPRSRFELEFFVVLFGAGLVFTIVLLLDDEIDIVVRMIHALPVAAVTVVVLFMVVKGIVENLPELVRDATGIVAAVGAQQVTVGWHEIAAVRVRRYQWREAIEIILHEQSDGSRPSRLNPAVGSCWTIVDGHRALVVSPARLRPHTADDVIHAMRLHRPTLFVAL